MDKDLLRKNFSYITVKTYYGKISYYATYKVNGICGGSIKIDDNEVHRVLEQKIRLGEFKIEEPKGKLKVARLIFTD